MADHILTQQTVKELLDYNQITGECNWKEKPNTKSPICIGQKIRNQDKDGYYRVFIHGKSYKLHRIAWLYVYGSWPTGQIDHINGVKTDNRICNLRDVNQSLNMHNIHLPSAGKKSCLPRGVYLEHGRYRARIKINNRVKNLGSFDTIIKAESAYLSAKREAST